MFQKVALNELKKVESTAASRAKIQFYERENELFFYNFNIIETKRSEEEEDKANQIEIAFFIVFVKCEI